MTAQAQSKAHCEVKRLVSQQLKHEKGPEQSTLIFDHARTVKSEDSKEATAAAVAAAAVAPAAAAEEENKEEEKEEEEGEEEEEAEDEEEGRTVHILHLLPAGLPISFRA